ncbi:hypothetical protein GCM10007879_26830 [Maritalea porphyrae]|uniref:Uncharacterized protein n=1 Tax=Maritalea porphyrae TaxID=880732 RepID=A0ABQ5UVK2_9HYPH|nr:hypothetical protein GCM10007879_26830 [Maritalea porphyrae]
MRGFDNFDVLGWPCVAISRDYQSFNVAFIVAFNCFSHAGTGLTCADNNEATSWGRGQMLFQATDWICNNNGFIEKRAK